MNVGCRDAFLRVTREIRRNYATISDYKIVWHRPRKVYRIDPEKSGDVGKDIKVNPNDLLPIYQNSKELESANETIRKLFTVGFHYNRDLNQTKQERMLDLVKRHKLDRSSEEARIAVLTAMVRHHQENLQVQPLNWRASQIAREIVDKRNKYLRILRELDYRRFEWILEKLDLVYKPRPETLKKPTRRESLTHLTETYCNDLVQKKLNAYRAELKKQQKIFYREKLEALQFIREQEEMCGIEPTVTEKDIEDTRKKVEEL